MKKLLLMFLCFLLFYACKPEKVKLYEEDAAAVFNVDTLNIEKIKIETH